MVKVKICANKSIEDAKMSLDAKADIIGILVGKKHESVDFVDKYGSEENALEEVIKLCEKYDSGEEFIAEVGALIGV